MVSRRQFFPGGSTALLLAIDIGNSRVKFGRFDVTSTDCQRAAAGGLLPLAGALAPEPVDTLALDPPLSGDAARVLAQWLSAGLAAGPPIGRVAIASVHRGVESSLIKLTGDEPLLANAPITQLTCERLPLATRVDHPDRVGVDRLLGAVAANRLRRPERAAIVVDLGTAITVDLVAADGAFEGGAILPGIAMASRALHERTDALPDCGLAELDASPDAVGKNTADAIHAGLFWGAVGAVRELIARQGDRLTEPPHVFLTGGAAPSVARLLGGPGHTVRYVPNLVLSGIAIAAEALAGEAPVDEAPVDEAPVDEAPVDEAP